MTTEPILLTAATDLATGTAARRFGGREHGDGIDVSFFLNHVAPGRGVDEHRHPYAEVFVVQGGEVIVSVDGIPVTARSGQVLVVPAGATAGSLGGGRRVWVLATLPEHVEVGGDQVRPYVLLMNSQRDVSHCLLRRGKMNIRSSRARNRRATRVRWARVGGSCGCGAVGPFVPGAGGAVGGLTA